MMRFPLSKLNTLIAHPFRVVLERGTINRTDEENGTCKSAPTDKHLNPKHARDRETDGWRKRWGALFFYKIDLA